MTNQRIAAILFNIATLLDMAQDNIYRVRAYRRAARRILALREEATAIVARGEELPLPGVGARMRRKLAELISTDSLAFYDELLEDLPLPVRALMALDGIGPITAQRLHAELGIASAQDLLAAAERGKVRALYGFGARREANLAHAARGAVSDLHCVA
jgi:DNA polymerase/3'-5' exonuclease PolX